MSTNASNHCRCLVSDVRILVNTLSKSCPACRSGANCGVARTPCATRRVMKFFSTRLFANHCRLPETVSVMKETLALRAEISTGSSAIFEVYKVGGALITKVKGRTWPGGRERLAPRNYCYLRREQVRLVLFYECGNKQPHVSAGVAFVRRELSGNGRTSRGPPKTFRVEKSSGAF